MSDANQGQDTSKEAGKANSEKPKSYAGVPNKRDEDERARPDLDRKQRGRNGR